MKYLRPENLYAVAERLWNVQIENRDALKLIVETDSPTALFYLDPPYPASTRTDKTATLARCQIMTTAILGNYF